MTYQAMADDVFEFISEHSLKNVSVIGHSMGGKVAMQMALQHPEIIKRLVIIDIAPFVKVTRGGAGASIQAADVAENIVSFGDPKGQLAGIFSIIQKMGYARVMKSAIARGLLIGTGKEKVRPTRTLGAIGAILATTTTDLEQESDIPVLGQ